MTRTSPRWMPGRSRGRHRTVPGPAAPAGRMSTSGIWSATWQVRSSATTTCPSRVTSTSAGGAWPSAPEAVWVSSTPSGWSSPRATSELRALDGSDCSIPCNRQDLRPGIPSYGPAITLVPGDEERVDHLVLAVRSAARPAHSGTTSRTARCAGSPCGSLSTSGRDRLVDAARRLTGGASRRWAAAAARRRPGLARRRGPTAAWRPARPAHPPAGMRRTGVCV